MSNPLHSYGVMENEMPIVRIVTTGTLVVAALGAAIASATAQSATQSAGRPLPLLQFTHHKTTKSPAHPKIAAKSERKTVTKQRVAKRTIAAPHRAVAAASPRTVAAAPQTPQLAAASTLPANMWPAAGTVAPGMTGTLAPPQATSPVSTASVVETNPNDIISGGQAVQVTSPDQVKTADLAADNHEQTANQQTANAQAPQTATPTDPVTPQPVATAFIARAETPDTPSPVGSASWIAQVLAALGGAITAGVVAWFLIRTRPEQTYG
jgi:hypothetical protein